jgi:hypothetical protein
MHLVKESFVTSFGYLISFEHIWKVWDNSTFTKIIFTYIDILTININVYENYWIRSDVNSIN